MINILIPIAGSSPFFEESGRSFPKPLYEVKGLPMIQRALETFERINEPKRFIFIIKKTHSTKFHLDNTLRLIGGDNCAIVFQENDAKGAACSCLLAIDHIDNGDPLIISNGDQVIHADIQEVIDNFRIQDASAGVISFDSVHPQWSYARLDAQGSVIEVAEKNPISRNAIAGFYYFSSGDRFVHAAKRMIEKGLTVNDLFYIAPAINELILEGDKVSVASIDHSCYFSFYSLDRVRDFEHRATR